MDQLVAELTRDFARARVVRTRRLVARLARDVAPVVVGIRTATLIDCVILSRVAATALGTALKLRQQQQGDDNDHVVVVHEDESGQTLVVNRRLLASRRRDATLFVQVGRPALSASRRPPRSFDSVLDQIASTARDSAFCLVSLPSDSDSDDPRDSRDLIPVVGYLLDYPIVYTVSSSSSTNCLGGIELILVEADLVV
ncbi:hypothetical protein JCM3766R1_002248, partial [Sporobolomyces carnicolor]